MSECVVRMKMPKCCDDCDANYDCCACGIIGAFWFRNPRYKEFDSSKERLPNCPIICQLPEGHGRLIDASTIIGEVDVGYTDDYGNPIPANRPISVDEYLGLEVPTIVPAKKERNINV